MSSTKSNVKIIELTVKIGLGQPTQNLYNFFGQSTTTPITTHTKILKILKAC